MSVEYGFPVLFADIDQAFLALVVVGGDGGDVPAAGMDLIAAVGDVEAYHVVNRMNLETVDENMVVEGLFHRFVAIDVQYALGPMAEVFVPVDEVGGEPVVHMAVGDQQRMDVPQIQAAAKGVAVGIRREINEQAAVQQGLGAGAQVFPARFPGVGADRAGTEQTGPALGGGSAHVEDIHQPSASCSSRSSQAKPQG